MGQTVLSSPLNITGSSTGETSGPSAFYAGMMLLDPRQANNYDSNQLTYGWAGGTTGVVVVDYVPAAISAVNIAAAQAATSGTALTLVSTTGAGVTVNQTITSMATCQQVTGLAAIDGPSQPVLFGQFPANAAWNPVTNGARAVRITSAGNDSSGTFTVRGYDEYFFPLTEVITGANAGIAAGKKPFKYIASVTPGGTVSGSNVSVGTSDVYDLPLAVSTWGYLEIFWNGALVTSSTGFTAADTTSPATGTTGSTRGSYATQSASDGTKRLTIFITVPLANLTSAAALCGVTNYAG